METGLSICDFVRRIPHRPTHYGFPSGLSHGQLERQESARSGL